MLLQSAIDLFEQLRSGRFRIVRLPLSTIVATLIVASCIVKAIKTWYDKPRRRDGKGYHSYSGRLDGMPSTPDADEHAVSWTSDFRLSRPKSLVRLQIARAQEEELLFTKLASLMRQVAFGFTCKSLVHAFLTMRAAHKDGVSALPAFFDSTDELTYAYLIRSAAAGFDASAEAVDVPCSDVSNMLEALQRLRELWEKMRLPLLVQTTIKVVQVILVLREVTQEAEM